MHPKSKKLYGREHKEKFDINKTFKNVVKANVIQNVGEYDAAGKGEYRCYL